MKNNQLYIDFFEGQRALELECHSKTHCFMKWTAGSLVFNLDSEGKAQSLHIKTGGMDRTEKRIN